MPTSDDADEQRPQFSAVIPTYNRRAFIARAVESALNQTYPPAEVIVIDDGSTDGTGEVLAGFPDSVRYVRQENSGVAAARNHGVRVASHDWIAFLDSDDTWFPDHLERMARAISETGGRATMYFADTLRSGTLEGKTEWQIADFSFEGPYKLVEDGTDWVLMPFHPMQTQSIVVNRHAYLAVGGSDPRLVVRSDTHAWLKLAFGKPLCAVAGRGGHLTADDASGKRLTDRRGSVQYYNTTILLYQDLLTGDWPLSDAHRRELRRRIAVAHWNLGRALARERRVLPAGRHLLTSVAMAPVDALRRGRRNQQTRRGARA